MISPFKHIDMAFTPFYDEEIAVTLKSGLKQTIMACVFNSVEGDPISDQSLDTTRQDIDINCRHEDWYFTKDIQRGDTIERPSNGKKYSVSDVSIEHNMGLIIHAREC